MLTRSPSHHLAKWTSHPIQYNHQPNPSADHSGRFCSWKLYTSIDTRARYQISLDIAGVKKGRNPEQLQTLPRNPITINPLSEFSTAHQSNPASTKSINLNPLNQPTLVQIAKKHHFINIKAKSTNQKIDSFKKLTKSSIRSLWHHNYTIQHIPKNHTTNSSKHTTIKTTLSTATTNKQKSEQQL